MSLSSSSFSSRRRNRSFEEKAEKIIRAWIAFLDLASLVSAKVEIGDEDHPNIFGEGVAIVGNALKLEEGLFKRLKAEASDARKRNADFKIAASFPKIYKVEDNKRLFQPLFTVDISSIFEGNFRKTGWDLTKQFEFQPVVPNLIDVAEIDEEKSEQLVTREGLRVFLEDTFKHSFNTLQDFLDLLVLPEGPQTVQYVPYLVRCDFVPYTYHLKKDLKKILDQREYWNWVHSGHTAFEYLFGRPKQPEDAVWYSGAFPTHAPTDSQVQIFKHLRCNPLTAAMGPPGCGKTVSFGHGIAMIVSDRALTLIESGQDESNLSLVTSTNNRAVQNVEELFEDASLSSLVLPGGSKETIKERSVPQLQKAILWLQETPFSESEQQATARALRERANQLQNELAQDPTRQQERQEILCKLEAVQQEITSLQNSLAEWTMTDSDSNCFDDYSQFPLETYQKIQSLLDNAKISNASAVAPPATPKTWLQRFFQPLMRLWRRLFHRHPKSDRSHLVDELDRLAAEVQSTLFPIQFQIPLSDSVRQEKRSYVATQIRSAQIWQSAEQISINLEQQKSYCSQLKQQLSTYPEGDFYSRFYSGSLHELQQEIFQLSQQYLRQEALRRKEEVRKSLELYAQILQHNDQDGSLYQKFGRQWRTVYQDLSLLFPVLTSTLHSIRNLLPFPDRDSLAYVFCDEAGATSVHLLFPALVRCKKALVVGDPLQLQPVVSFTNQMVEEYFDRAFAQQGLDEEDFDLYSPTSYETASAYQRAAGADTHLNLKGYGITLIEHFRCPEPIATLVDRLGGYGLLIKTTPVVPSLGSHLILSHIEGRQENEVNLQEVDAVMSWVEHLYALGYSFGSTDKTKTIAVLSPYRKQANALRRALQQHWHDCNHHNTNTIHTFQGGAKAIILLSTRQCHPSDSLLFLNRGPNLLNVAASRTTESLIVVGNSQRLREGIYSQIVVDHTNHYGELRSPPASSQNR